MPGWTTQWGRKLHAVLVAALLASVGALACGCASAAAARRASAPAARRAAAPRNCAGANLHPNASDLAAVDAATLCLVNGVRVAHDARPLRANDELDDVAASQIASMLIGDYFADVSPSGQTALSVVAGTPYPAHAASFAIGQNLAWGYGQDVTPAHIVAEWMASPPHRTIMLGGEYRDAGVAVAPSAPALLDAPPPDATYAFEFGVRF